MWGVVGPPEATHEVIVSAHMDAYRQSPGADDDASGLGVLLELARHFKTLEGSLQHRIRFIAFGAEELGLAGARAYTAAHIKDLENCLLSLELDQLGGPIGPHVGIRGGVVGPWEKPGGLPWPDGLEGRALEGVSSDWRLVDERILPLFGLCNHPNWLVNLVERGAEELSISINPTGNLGGDEYAFTMAGVVATIIGSGGNVTHAPGDLPSQVRLESLDHSGRLAERMVREVATKDPDWSGVGISESVGQISASNDPRQRQKAVVERLTRRDLDHRLESFESSDRQGTNIVIGEPKVADPTILLVAHYDCVPEGLGAVDDAAGVAAVIDLMDRLARHPLTNLSVQGLISDIEEDGMQGAEAYLAKGRNPRLVLNFDTFGYGEVLWLTGGGVSPSVRTELEASAKVNSLAVTWEENTPPGDDRVFREAGIETVGSGFGGPGRNRRHPEDVERGGT